MAFGSGGFGKFSGGSNLNMPRPTRAGNIGPPRVQMPKMGGDPQARSSFGGSDMSKSSMGPKLSPLPAFPQHSMKGTANSLIQSQTKKPPTGGVGLDLLQPKGM